MVLFKRIWLMVLNVQNVCSYNPNAGLILNRSEACEHDYTWFPATSNLEITGKRLWAILKYYVNVFKYIVLSLKYFN